MAKKVDRKGKCGACGQPALPGKSRCEKHLKLANEKGKARYQTVKTATVCTDCGEAAPVKGKLVCQSCDDKRIAEREERRAEDLTHYARRRLAGQCVRCQNPAPDGAYCEEHTRIRKQEYDDRDARGVCVDCANPRDRSSKRCQVCFENRNALLSDRKAAGVCPYCGGKSAAEPGSRCKFHVQQHRKKDRRKAAKLRHDTIMAYGGYQCACPGCHVTAAEFLHIDHTANDGAAHRRLLNGKNSRAGLTVYTWIRKHNFPPGFQVLCANCNLAKGRYGKCPLEGKDHFTGEPLTLT